jgi:hypothetical protein
MSLPNDPYLTVPDYGKQNQNFGKEKLYSGYTAPSAVADLAAAAAASNLQTGARTPDKGKYIYDSKTGQYIWVPATAAAAVSTGLAASPAYMNQDRGGGDGRDPNPGGWGSLSPAQQAAYMSANPTMGKISDFALSLLNNTILGRVIGAVNPQGLTQAGLINKGITPATTDRSLGNYGVGQSLGQNNSPAIGSDGTGTVSGGTEGMGGGTGLSVGVGNASIGGDTVGGGLSLGNTSNNGTVSGGTEGMGGGTGLSAPSNAGNLGSGIGTVGAEGMGGGTGLSVGNVGVGQTGTTSGLGVAVGGGEGGGGGGGGSRVICTHFYRKGEMDRNMWRADLEFTFKHLSPTTVRGYQYWAIPYVKLMRKSKLAEDIIRPLAFARAKELTYQMGRSPKGSVFGKVVRLVCEPICFSVGLFVGEQNWQALWTPVKD